MASRTLNLADGRHLEYVTAGDASGFPLVFLHGTPGARVIIPSLAAACEKKGLKLIMFSRSGYGGSSR
jgi:pimeloyl-ACP methyl ester carboxylesterase